MNDLILNTEFMTKTLKMITSNMAQGQVRSCPAQAKLTSITQLVTRQKQNKLQQQTILQLLTSINYCLPHRQYRYWTMKIVFFLAECIT